MVREEREERVLIRKWGEICINRAKLHSSIGIGL